MKEDAELGGAGPINAAIRNAKKANRPTRIGVPEKPRDVRAAKTKERKAQRKKKDKLSKIGFKEEIGVKRKTGSTSREGARAKKGDAIGGNKKKGKGKKNR